MTLEAGNKTYQFDLSGLGTFGGTLLDADIYGIYDTNGVLYDRTTNYFSIGTYQDARTYFSAPEKGKYFVGVGGVLGSSGFRTVPGGTYTLSVTEATDDDYASSIGTDGEVAVGSSVNGSMDFFRDYDWFAVTLEANRTYRFDLEGNSTGEAPAWRAPNIDGIYDANGDLMPGTRDDGAAFQANVRTEFTPTTDGTYFAAVGAQHSLEGAYTLWVTDLTDIAADTSTTGEITVGDSTRGYVNSAGDQDWYAVQLVEGKTYRFDLKGSSSGDGTLRDPNLRGIHDSAGTLIPGTTNDDGGMGDNSRVEFTATGTDPIVDDETVTYYVSAGADGDGTGTYLLSVEEVM